MENRFNNNPEEREDWGAYAKPPPRHGETSGERKAATSPPTLCARVREMLPELSENDGTIRPEMATAIHAHLGVCTPCSQEFNEMQRMIALMNSMPLLEMPMDYSALVMQRIEAEVGNLFGQADAYPTSAASFEPPKEAAHTPPTTQAQNELSNAVMQIAEQTRMSLWQRISLLGAFFATLIVFLTSPWGRATLQANLETSVVWLRQIADTTRDIPILGWVTGQAYSVIAQSLRQIEIAYQELGAVALRGAMFDIALTVAVYYFWRGRRLRAHNAEV